MSNNFPHEIMDIVLEELAIGLTLVDQKGEVIYFNNLAGQLLGWKDNGATNTVLKCHNPKIHNRVVEKISNNKKSEWHRIIKIKDKYI
ncbi:MAG: PAS domain-containing protein [Peptococcales bacterium]